MIAAETGIAAVLKALATGLAPDRIVSTVVWASANFIVPDGPYVGEKWNPQHAPYLAPILDAIDDETTTVVSVRKSAQTGFTTAAMAWLGKNIVTAPSRDMVIFPTINSAQDFNREKLSPAIDATPELQRRVREQTSRSARGSTLLSKVYPGGLCTLTGANSTADLRSKTTRRHFRDEIDDWPDDLDGQGDPYGMADARQIAFHATGDWKVFEGSTPTIKGGSRIDAQFDAGDQRFFEVPCPHCGEFQRLVFGTAETRFGLKFNREFPYEAYYICRHNGCVIEHHEKRAMVGRGRFVAQAFGPGRHPSFHVDALISLLTTWDSIAKAFLNAKGNPLKLKSFVNLWLGESWEERGEAPDHKRLMARRDDYAPRTIPPGAVVITGAADVQTDGIYYEIVAWGVALESWSIDAGFLPGSTASRSEPVWRALDEVHDRRYADAYGQMWPADVFAVDAGFHAHVVYDWCRRRPRARAIKGVDGWYKPPISSEPRAQDISYGGRKLKRGARLWQIGVWPLKSALYANLRKEGKRDGAEVDPPGFCHFTDRLHDEVFFRQLTAEYLADREVSGRKVKRWLAIGPNHFHDCRIYNMAMAEHLQLGSLDTDGWRRLAARRGVPEPDQVDLFRPDVSGQAATGALPAAPARRRVRRVLRGRS